MTGRVKWFNDKRGYGFIAADNCEDIFVHYSGIKDIPILYENEKVIFDITLDKRGLPRAVNVEQIAERMKNG